MAGNEEDLLQASSIIESAVGELRGSLQLGIPLWDDEVQEICERLEFASIMMRS
jgi:hypothetical protein